MIEMLPALTALPPGILLIVGPLLLLLVRGRAQQVTLVALPILSYLHLLGLPAGEHLTFTIFGDLQMTVTRIDRLAMVWGHIFHIAAILSAVYAAHVRDVGQHIAGLAYAGAAIGAVFAGDLATLFIYWELTAVASVFLIWARDNIDAASGTTTQDRNREACYRTGIRYLIIQVASGVVLLAGILLRTSTWQGEGDALTFGKLFDGNIFEADLATQLIFIAFGIKAAFPLLHNWLQDAYPKATHTGTVFLSAFTTKMAIYALARGFAGTELLIVLGVVMTAFPIFFAVIENDLRRVLAYSLNNQLGFMCVGIGIGTELALNGAAAHAFAHILYKSLLFQSMGAVLYRVGTCKATELGGLYKSMPWTTGFCIVGSASISAFPLFSGFVTKSMILSAAAEEHMTAVFLCLLFASAGVLDHSGIKIPYFAFFAHDSGKRPPEAPSNMLVAMGITAALCILIGCFPGPLYSILPFDADYHAYTSLHVVAQLQLLMFAIAAFIFLNRIGVYPDERRATILDTDWTYRRLLPIHVVPRVRDVVERVWNRLIEIGQASFGLFVATARLGTAPSGLFGRPWLIGQIAGAALVLYGLYLLLELFVVR